MARVAFPENRVTPTRVATTVGVVHAAVALAILRILASYSWLNSTFYGKDAKLTPDFLSGKGLTMRINDLQMGFVHTVLMPWVATFLTGVVVPHATLFACLPAWAGPARSSWPSSTSSSRREGRTQPTPSATTTCWPWRGWSLSSRRRDAPTASIGC
jgi:hypothetical protein